MSNRILLPKDDYVSFYQMQSDLKYKYFLNTVTD